MTKLGKTIAYFESIILIPLCLILAACSDSESRFVTLDGQSRQLSDYRGQWVLVNFWAEWCAPCLEEVPELNRLAQDKSLNLAVVGVSYDPLENAELKAIYQQWEFAYPVMASDPVPILPFGLPPQLPTNYLLDPQGEIAAKLVGKQDYHSITSVIAKLQQSAK